MNPELLTVLTRLGDYAEKRGYAGYDPYDMLNSPLAPLLSLGTRYGRIGLTQLGRRSPINFRFLLGVRPGVNPKALALFLEGYGRLYRVLGQPELAERMNRLTDRLAALRSPGIAGNGWGYNFPWQNRYLCLPRYTPTIVNTAFVGHSLLDCYESTGNAKALDMALAIPSFILHDLKRKAEGGTFCFSYTPRDENFVHNANMLGASLLVRIGTRYQRPELLDPGLAALGYSMKHQHDDGSWAYAETQAQRWIDSFHTGFNLEALRRILGCGAGAEYQAGYRRGVDFYARNFFLADGTPKYYHDRLYLTDIHAPAEAICFFAGEGEPYRELTERTLAWTLANMYDARRGIFYFRKSSWFTIRIPYMRWSEAWAFRALACYYAESGGARGAR